MSSISANFSPAVGIPMILMAMFVVGFIALVVFWRLRTPHKAQSLLPLETRNSDAPESKGHDGIGHTTGEQSESTEDWKPRFREALIRAAEEASASVQDTRLAATSTQLPNIIVVNDERIVADTLVTILKLHDYQAVAAYSGSEAVQKALELRPWLVLCDLIMRDMNGIETAVRITTTQPGCRIVLSSAQSDIQDLVDVAESLGYKFQFVAAPFHPHDLIEQIKKMLSVSEHTKETRKSKVLLVDDERIVADTLAIILRQQGYECEVAYRGASAIETAQRIRPRFIVMDISLPDRWGTEVAKIILDEQPQCRVILYSGAEHAERDDFEPLRQRGYQFDSLAAPFRPQELLRILRDYEHQDAGNSSTPSARLKSILYMDDHEVLARLSCEILELQGYRAVPIYDATKVMAKMQEEAFDLVITDEVHSGPRGTELVRMIHQTYPKLPVVMASGYLGPDKCPDDFAACIPKEELFPALLEVIKREIGEGLLGARQ